MAFTLHVRNLRALRTIQWSPTQVCGLVGPNGSGKTTLLLALKLIRVAFEHDLPTALTQVFGGSYKLRNAAAQENEPIELGIDTEDLSWRVTLSVRGPSVEPFAAETVTEQGGVILQRIGLARSFDFKGAQLGCDERLAIREATDARSQDPTLRPLVDAIKGTQIFYDPDLYGLRFSGSPAGMTRHLASRANNVFAVLRAWNERREHRVRYQFVLDGLRSAFPDLCTDVDFESAGQTVTMNLYRPNDEVPVSITHAANGVLAMLVHLCSIASAEQGGLVAIDEPENSLHPYAIRRLLDCARQWAKKVDLTIILTTHSPVVLNEFRTDPQKLFVMQPDQPVLPVALAALRDPNWLADFELGELYANYEYGSFRSE